MHTCWSVKSLVYRHASSLVVSGHVSRDGRNVLSNVPVRRSLLVKAYTSANTVGTDLTVRRRVKNFPVPYQRQTSTDERYDRMRTCGTVLRVIPTLGKRSDSLLDRGGYAIA